MPYLNDAELAREVSRARNSDSSLVRRQADAADDEAPSLGIVPVIASMGTAAVVGFLRSKFEDASTGELNLPGTRYDAEAVAFLALGGVALGGQYIGLGAYRSYAALGALGVGSHYVGEVARRFGKTGKLSFTVGAGVPPWDPTSFDPTQVSDPYADAQARGLASSGV